LLWLRDDCVEGRDPRITVRQKSFRLLASEHHDIAAGVVIDVDSDSDRAARYASASETALRLGGKYAVVVATLRESIGNSGARVIGSSEILP
jgi:hypothetical protein